MSLFSTLSSAANSLSVFENALTVTQNNISNASTPGYVTQTPTFEAQPFVDGTGETGGVSAGAPQSARDDYAEMNVRNATSQVGYSQQQVESLSSLNSQFDISGNSGVPAGLTQLYSAFSTWAATPSSGVAQQGVLTGADNLASDFRATAANLTQIAQGTDTQTSSLVDQVNQLAAQLGSYNTLVSQGGQADPGTDASINSTLERLSQIANVVTIKQPNGTFNVMLGGQTELVDGAAVNKLTAAVYIPTSSSAASGHAVTVPINISAQTNALNLKIDGVTLPAMQLSASDKTASDVAVDINTQLQAAGSTATANVDAQGRLVITSGSTGAAASVAILPGSANSTLGFSVTPPPHEQVLDASGNDITSQITSGQLGAAIQVRNQSLPAIEGDINQTGDLNRMAKSFADRVNGLLGVPLFTYDQTDAANVAASLQLNPAVTAAQLPSSQVVALTGSAPATPFTITPGSNDTLNLVVDGTALPALTLNPADSTLSAVVSDLNTQFGAQGIGASASIDANTGALKLQTTNSGNNGSIQILPGTANATLGLTSPTPTYQNNANSVALTLAGLANPSSTADKLDGQSFTEFFGGIAANVGAQLASAKDNQTAQQDVLTQAQSLRQQVSGVDLNEEATRVLQLQTSYQAASRMMNVIDTLTQAVLGIIPQSA